MKFVLISTQRSGSTWVSDMLNSHPQIKSYSELLLKNAEGFPKWGGEKDFIFFNSFLKLNGNPKSISLVNRILFEYLDKLYFENNDFLAIGFKLMYGQAGEYSNLINYMKTRKIKIIHLIRRNFLDIIISKEAAVKKNIFHSRSEQKSSFSLKVKIGEIVNRIQWEEQQIEKAKNIFSSLNLPYFEVYYEDLVSSEEGFQPILKFLNMNEPYKNLNSSLMKLNIRPHKEIIENYDELVNVLINTRYKDFL